MESLLEFTGAAAYATVGIMAMAESGLFLGLVVPGETAMILAGVLVARGHAELGWMVMSACLGAIAGDSVSYEVGRRFGPKLVTTRLGRRIGADNWRRARAYVRARGGRAVLFGRFVGVLRALVPGVAGWAGMRYRSFLAFNVAGGLIWATGTIMMGVLAGHSWQLLEQWVGRTSIAVAAFLVGLGLVLFIRWLTKQRKVDRAPPAEDSAVETITSAVRANSDCRNDSRTVVPHGES